MGVNRLSFGIQDFDPLVQEQINRIQPPELVSNLLTDEVRSLFPAINFDLLVGLPAQTLSGLKNTIKEVVKLRPTQLQTMYVHYKPDVRKYMIRMVRNGMPDFYDRKALFNSASTQLINAGYARAGFESYALPGDELATSIEEKKSTTHWALIEELLKISSRLAVLLMEFSATPMCKIVSKTYKQSTR